MQVEVFQKPDTLPETWRVEAYDTDGGVDVNIFSGGADPKRRAIEYADWK